jgi:predicted O-methyltransferase YrrM
LEEPPLVRRALAAADRVGFTRSCMPEVGRLLHLLAAQRGRSRVGEIGTGAGVGAAWIVSGLASDTPFVTVEVDPVLVRSARDLFAADANVEVVEGDWHRELPSRGPFDLLFYDGGGKQRPDLDGEDVVGLLTPGATVVMDDLTPGGEAGDPVRVFWLGHPDLAAVEVLTTRATAAIVAVRVR